VTKSKGDKYDKREGDGVIKRKGDFGDKKEGNGMR
jgi:hypothetical protein